MDLDQATLRVGCRTKMYDYVLPIARDEVYGVKNEYGRACEALLLLEVFGQPQPMKERCCQILLSIYQDQADDIFSRFSGREYFYLETCVQQLF